MGRIYGSSLLPGNSTIILNTFQDAYIGGFHSNHKTSRMSSQWKCHVITVLFVRVNMIEIGCSYWYLIYTRIWNSSRIGCQNHMTTEWERCFCPIIGLKWWFYSFMTEIPILYDWSFSRSNILKVLNMVIIISGWNVHHNMNGPQNIM